MEVIHRHTFSIEVMYVHNRSTVSWCRHSVSIPDKECMWLIILDILVTCIISECLARCYRYRVWRRHKDGWRNTREAVCHIGTGAPVILGRCPSVSAWEWVYATNLYRLQKETSKRYVGEAHSALITAILSPQRLRCYVGKTVSLRMHTNLRLVDSRLTTAQQRSTSQNLPSDLYSFQLWSLLAEYVPVLTVALTLLSAVFVTF
jgi:hypothetical protein